MSDNLTIAGREFGSRLILGTGKYDSPETCLAALEASGTEIVTVAIRRLDLDNPDKPTELEYIDWNQYTILPNTAGCKTVDEALLTARLGRELTSSEWVKLEVIPDPKYLLPDPIGTLEAAQTLIGEGFTVLPYIHADPALAGRLEETGCAPAMPLGALIGAGRGVVHRRRVGKGGASVPGRGRGEGQLRRDRLHAVAAVAAEAHDDRAPLNPRFGGCPCLE